MSKSGKSGEKRCGRNKGAVQLTSLFARDANKGNIQCADYEAAGERGGCGMEGAKMAAWGALCTLATLSGGCRCEGEAVTGIVYSPAYLKHDAGVGHPERPERLEAIMRGLEAAGYAEKLARIEPFPAPLEWLETVHAREYIKEVERACIEGVKWLHTPDVGISAASYDAARLAAGGALAAVDAVMAGRVRNAFCAVRPPGHHALRNRAMGFCLFNNAAIAARYAQKKHGARKSL